MKDILLEIQKNFIDLLDLIIKHSAQNNLDEVQVIDDINDALSNTYVLLNQGFCKSHIICKKCVENRDKLHHLIILVDEFEKNEEIKEEVFTALEDFANEIPSLLTKIETIYLETLAESQS